MKLEFIFISIVMLSSSLYSAQHQEHKHHESHQVRLTLNNGAKWASDAPLRNSMDSLRAAFQEKLHAIHHNELPRNDFQMLGKMTNDEIGKIIANCKLSPEADAVLHLIIADMLTGANQMIEGSETESATGAHKVAVAINQYGTYFEHPEWQMIE